MKVSVKCSTLSKDLQARIKKELSSAKGAYWNEKGDFQKEYDQIWKDFIPAEGRAKEAPAEAVRAVSRLYYDCYNNGWGNDRRSELKLLRASVNKLLPFYKGHTPLKTLLQDLGQLQTAVSQERYNRVKSLSTTSIEPDLDNLVDAVVQYAHKELYKKELSYDYNQDKVEVIRPTTPNGLTIIHLGIADTVVIKPADLADIKRLSDGDMLWFKDGDNLNTKWEVTFKGDKITFKCDSTVITVTREELFGKEEASIAEFKSVEKSLIKYLDSIIVEPTRTDRVVPVDSYKVNSIKEETRLRGHLGDLIIDVGFKPANYLPHRFQDGLKKDLETLLNEWAKDELTNNTHFNISLEK